MYRFRPTVFSLREPRIGLEGGLAVWGVWVAMWYFKFKFKSLAQPTTTDSVCILNVVIIFCFSFCSVYDFKLSFSHKVSPWYTCINPAVYSKIYPFQISCALFAILTDSEWFSSVCPDERTDIFGRPYFSRLITLSALRQSSRSSYTLYIHCT